MILSFTTYFHIFLLVKTSKLDFFGVFVAIKWRYKKPYFYFLLFVWFYKCTGYICFFWEFSFKLFVEPSSFASEILQDDSLIDNHLLYKLLCFLDILICHQECCHLCFIISYQLSLRILFFFSFIGLSIISKFVSFTLYKDS